MLRVYVCFAYLDLRLCISGTYPKSFSQDYEYKLQYSFFICYFHVYIHNFQTEIFQSSVD